MSSVNARYFDGQSSRLFLVTVAIERGMVIVRGDGIERAEPLSLTTITDVLGGAPRQMRFGDGAFCEITNREAFARLLAEHGIQASTVSQWEGSVPWIVAGAATFVLLLVMGYLYAIPAAATLVANQVPPGATEALSGQVLTFLDDDVFTPSEIPQARQDEIVRRFRELRLPSRGAGADYRITFRKSPILGANALALPSGTIVVTDGLVQLAEDDREILGVLAHEAGHVDRRHGLRNVLQNSIVGLAIAWFIGDISTIAAAAPTALIEATYSRDLEREADAYAVETLHASGIGLRHLADILRRLDEENGGSDASGALAYLSSHPATAERLQLLESQ